MLETTYGRGGLVTAPHHLAAQAGLDILKAGGHAVEAAVATAATLAVVYPHMTGIGGDGFWIIAEPGRAPIAIDSCGRAAGLATPDAYAEQGLTSIPTRGPLAANTVAGTLAGWSAALDATRHWGTGLPRLRLLEAAIGYARDGFVVTRSQSAITRLKQPELEIQPGFAEAFLSDGRAPGEGEIWRLPDLASTLEELGRSGFDSFYRGDLARTLAHALEQVGSPLRLADLDAHAALVTAPLSLQVRGARLFNMPPPTQGIASLMILGIFDRLGVTEAEGFAHVHGLVEATKQAFLLRDQHVGDPDHMSIAAADLLDPAHLARLAARIDRARALPWPAGPSGGDTVWFGVCDREGRSVSMIQSIYFEFGSGVVLPGTGIAWQNRGASFRLASAGWNCLKPGRKPFHTLNPAMAAFDDGRHMAYGTMGGEGQPQTQAAVFSRYGWFGTPLQRAVTAPRWLLGRTWGETSVSLKVESRLSPALVEALAQAGHNVEVVDDFTDLMGHAGALVHHPSGVIEGASDPRSDGSVASI